MANEQEGFRAVPEPVYIDRWNPDFALPRAKGEKASRRPSQRNIGKCKKTHWSPAASLRPGRWLSETCAFGDPREEHTQNAIAIREAYRFRPVVRLLSKTTAELEEAIHQGTFFECGRAGESSSSIGASRKRKSKPAEADLLFPDEVLSQRDQVLRDALRFAHQRVKFSTELRMSPDGDDAASAFCTLILHKVDCGQYTEDGRLLHWLSAHWKYFEKRYLREVWREKKQRGGFRNENALDGSGEASQSTALFGTLREGDSETGTREADAVREFGTRVRELVEKLSPEERNLCQLIVELQGSTRNAKKPTNQQLADKLGISETAVRKRLKKIKRAFSPLDKSACDYAAARAAHGGVLTTLQAVADIPRQYLTPEEAAEYLGGLNSRTVTRWAREGYLPAIPLGEGKRRLWRFRQADLDQWMVARRTEGQAAA